MNRTGMTGVVLYDKIKNFLHNNSKPVRMAVSLLVGFVMAHSFVWGGISPFGVAVCGALTGADSCFAAFGALLGYIFTVESINIKYIAAVFLMVIFKWAFEHKLKWRRKTRTNVITTMLAMLISSMAVILAANYSIYKIILDIAELLLTCGTVYFFSRAVILAEQGIAGAPKQDISCMVVSAAVLIAGLSVLHIGGFSVGRIFAVASIMLFAHYGGEAAGAVAGITGGIAAGISDGDYAYVVSAYSLGGLLAGFFGNIGRTAAAGAFIVVNALAAFFVSTNVDVYKSVSEVFVASLIFMVLPGGFVKKLQTGLYSSSSTGDMQVIIKDRLWNISETLKDIGNTTQNVSGKLSKLERPGLSEIYSNISDKVCKHCGMKTACWQTNQSITVAEIGRCISMLKKTGGLGRENMPPYFANTCCKTDMLITELNTSFNNHIAREGARRKISQVRLAVTDQFEGMAMMLDALSDEICATTVMDKAKVQRVKDFFEREGFTQEKLFCCYDEFDRAAIELQVPIYQAARLDKLGAVVELNDILEADFCRPRICAINKSAVIHFSERAEFAVEIGVHQISKDSARLCGDSYDYVMQRDGKAHIILSDGMGSGGNAAVDSMMAAKLTTKLLSAGIQHEAALKMVNSALFLKSGEESLSTLDICTLDLFTGKADFYKAGAVASFVIRNGKAGYIESISLPAGILREVAFEKSSLTLRHGDVVVLVSDGVVATGTRWILSELEAIETTDIQQMCEKLAATAKERREDGKEDDITVLAAVISK